jgi:N-acetylgalactosamine-6-sulfatase
MAPKTSTQEGDHEMSRTLLVVALMLFPLSSVNASSQTKQPNIIFILADDLGWGDLSCYGNLFLKTPNLDRLAAKGTLFTQFYVNGSVCSPSRCAFFTGQYPARQRIHGHFATPEQNKARGMPDWLDPTVPNVARLLRLAGYTTGHVGKWHLGRGNSPNAPAIDRYGFDFVGTGETGGAVVDKKDPHFRARSTALFVDEAIDFIKKAGKQPFYLQLWTLVPHATLNPTAEQMKAFEKFSSPNVAHKSARTIYYASVADLDKQVGRLLDALERMGLADDTVVIFSSDNGPEDIFILNAGHSGVGSTGPFRGRKRSLYEGGVRVPFIVCWPSHVPAKRIENDPILAGVDLLPTLMKLAGINLPREFKGDGEDMSDILLGQSRSRSKALLWEWRFNIAGHPLNKSPILAIREGKWKLHLNPDKSRLELYDIPKDPMQVHNIADRHPEVVTRLADSAIAWQGGLPQGPFDPSAGKLLLSWPGESQPLKKGSSKKNSPTD